MDEILSIKEQMEATIDYIFSAVAAYNISQLPCPIDYSVINDYALKLSDSQFVPTTEDKQKLDAVKVTLDNIISKQLQETLASMK